MSLCTRKTRAKQIKNAPKNLQKKTKEKSNVTKTASN